MAKEEIYRSVIRLNTEDAQNKMDDLKKRVQDLVALRDTIDKKKDSGYYKSVSKQINAAKAELRVYENEVMKTIKTLDNLGNASAKEIRDAQKSLQKMIDAKPQGAEEMGDFVRRLQEVKQELQNIATMRAFDEVKAGITGTGKSAQQLGAEMRFLRETSQNVGTASAQQLEKALEVAREHLRVAEQGSKAYERSSGYIRSFTAQLEKVKEEQRKSNTLIDRYNKELKEAGKEEKAVADEATLIKRTLDNISGASMRDLEYSIKAVSEQMKDMDRNSDGYKEAEKKVRMLRTELERTKQEAGAQQSMFGKIITGLNKNWGAITQIIGAVTGLSFTVRRCVEAFAEMDQEINNVRKYTGQTIEEVRAMNEEFKRMDTRTPREQLNQLAGSAGRLGIQGTEAVKDFVYAADQINLALGDDLGQGAVDKIGKLTMAFGEDDRMGLRNAMLSTGSAVNELAQNSSANAGYLVDFAARLSGVGVQAGLTQAQILGLGAAMDENMQRDEMAATAISQIITKMTTDSATFARIAGKNVEAFAKLVKEDMNTALLQFFEAMNKKGGFAELAPLFEQMGLDGTRAIGVLSTLSSKIADVQRHQELATKAYQEHKSVEEEAAIQNKTYQAQLEKARKAFNDLKVELGESLLPVVSMTITTGGVMVKTLSTVTSFVLKFRTTIILLSVTIAALTAVRYKDIVAAKLQNFWNVTLMGNLKKLYAVMLANPYAAVAVAAAALVGIIADLTRRSNEATVAQKAMASIEHDATVKAEKERQKIEELRKKIHDNNIEVDKRRQYIEELQKIVPDYVAKISEEGRVYEESTEALDKYIQKIKEKAMVDGARRKMEELAEERAELVAERLEQAEKNKEIKKRQQTGPRGAIPGSVGIWDNKAEEAVSDAAGEALLKSIDNKIAETDKAIELMGKVAEDAVKTVREAGGSGADDSSGNYDTRSFWEQELKDRRAKLKALREDAKATAVDIEEAAKSVKEAEDKMELFTGAKAGAKQERTEDKNRRERERKANDAAKAETEQQLAELTHRYAMGQILYCDYIDEQERIQLEGIERRMLIYRTESLEYQKLNRKREELLLNGSEESQKLTLEQMKQGHEQRLAAIEEQAWRENMTEQQKNENIFLEDMRFMDEQRILYRNGTLERINLEREIDERDQQQKLLRQQYYQQQVEQVREQYLGMGNERQRQIALNGLEELHEKELLSEREYQEALLAIKAQYANYQTRSEHDQQVGANALKVAQSNAQRQIDSSGSSSANLPIVGDIMLYQSTMEQLKLMYQSDEMTHAQYLAAKQQATAQFCESLASQMQAAYNAVNQVMSAASSYFSAQQEYETSLVQKKYEKQIAAAGNNQAKVKKLQEQQQKEEAAIKSKYAKRAANIQMAQAVAQTAISAINAYSSAAAIPVTGYVLAPIAAAAAIAAGMLQIATIKKQQQAQESGYYEGGFTGGRRYRREAGVVHEGEFVANHQAVSNPNVLPFLNFLDQAQRNNTVGSLTMQDVSRSMGAGGSSQIVAPIVNVQTDNEELREAVAAHREATELLLERLERPINAQVVLTGPDGLNEQQERLNNMLKNK